MLGCIWLRDLGGGDLLCMYYTASVFNFMLLGHTRMDHAEEKAQKLQRAQKGKNNWGQQCIKRLILIQGVKFLLYKFSNLTIAPDAIL